MKELTAYERIVTESALRDYLHEETERAKAYAQELEHCKTEEERVAVEKRLQRCLKRNAALESALKKVSI